MTWMYMQEMQAIVWMSKTWLNVMICLVKQKHHLCMNKKREGGMVNKPTRKENQGRPQQLLIA